MCSVCLPRHSAVAYLFLVRRSTRSHMFDDLSAHFHEHLVPLYIRYREIREESKAGLSRDLQAATAAANALYHFREHLPQSHAMSRAAVAALCSDYDLVGDIANV